MRELRLLPGYEGSEGCGLLCGYLGGGDMPAVMAIVLGLTIAGILAMFLVWRELDRMDRFWEEMDEWGRRR